MRRALLTAALLLAGISSLHAEAGRTAAAILKKPLSARPLGMGEAYAAVEGGISSLGYNPAGIARIARPELETTYNQGFASDHFGFLGYSHPLSFCVLTGGFIYYDAGKIDINLSNGTQETRTAEQDLAGLLGISLPLSHGLSAGATAKFFRLELAQEARARGYAGDAGATWRTPLPGLKLGAAAQNLGPNVKFEEEGDPLPMTLRFGAAYDFTLENLSWFQEGGYGFSKFLFTADAVKVREETWVPSAGMETSMNLGEACSGALRFGYIFSRELNNLTLGLGLRQSRWSLDYALGAMKKVSNTHHVSLGVKF